MRLYVMRHGPAEDFAPSGRDADRALSPDGRAIVRRLGEGLLQQQLEPTPRWIASPLLRARQTIDIVRATWCRGGPAEPVELRDELEPDDDAPFDLVNEVAAEARDTFLVGHQPALEVLVRSLVASTTQDPRALLPSGFRTAMVVVLDGDAGGWSLDRIIDPRAT